MIRLDPKGKEEALRTHWQKIFKIQPEVNNGKSTYKTTLRRISGTRNNRIQHNLNALISPVTAEEVKARISSLKKKKAPGVSKINAQLLYHVTLNIIQQITNI